MIDVDGCEYCVFCYTPLALIENQCSEHKPKPAQVTTNLAMKAGLPAYTLSYEEKDEDITRVQIQKLWPHLSDVKDWTPQEFAEFLWSLRVHHWHDCERRPARSLVTLGARHD